MIIFAKQFENKEEQAQIKDILNRTVVASRTSEIAVFEYLGVLSVLVQEKNTLCTSDMTTILLLLPQCNLFYSTQDFYEFWQVALRSNHAA